MANAIDKFPVPLIIKKILKDRMSGELIISENNSTRTLFFIDSRLEFATTTVETEHLGDVLLEEGKITREQLRLALEIRGNVPTKIGEILAKTCDLTMGNIYDALVKQVIKIASATFPLKEGEWRFIKKKPLIPNPQNLKVKLPEVIRDGVKKITDISYYKRKFYYRSPVMIELPETADKILSHEETELYKRLTQFTNISVKHIISNLKLPESIFWRIIIMFYLLNMADFVEFTVDDEEQNKKIEEINDMYRKIKSGQSDYFQLLESDKIVTVAEVNERFHEYSDRYDPEKLKVAPDSTAMRRARKVFEEIRNAHTAVRIDIENKIDSKKEKIGAPGIYIEEEAPLELDISSKIQPTLEIEPNRREKIPAKKEVEPENEPPLELEKNDKIRQAPALGVKMEGELPVKSTAVIEDHPAVILEAKKADQVKRARELFTKANHLHNRKNYSEAAALLQQAVAIDDSRANYFLLLGLCLSRMPATKKMAEKSLKKAAQMETWNADPVFALGQLYKSENLMKKAKVYFEKALELNMEHTLAGKAMDEFAGMGDKKSLFSLFSKKNK